MKNTPIMLAVATILTLVGCAGQDPISKAQSSCEVIFADPDAQRMLAEIDADAEGFCSCMMDGLKEMPETDQANSILAFNTVASQAQETGRPIEDIARELSKSDIEDQFSDDQTDLVKGMNLTERLIDATGNAIEEGTCAAR